MLLIPKIRSLLFKQLVWQRGVLGLSLVLGLFLIIQSQSPRVSAIVTFTVTTTNDNGDNLNPTPGSLRRAIIDANTNPGADIINFNIPGIAPFTISPLSPLPDITEAVTINGTTQPGFAGTPVIELNGISAGATSGLTITAANCVVRGLVINRFNGNGIAISGNGNSIEGNFIGTSVSGSVAVGNTLDGIFISGAGNSIGGTTTAARNVISSNRNGIQLFGAPATGNQIRGNFIGTDAGGTLALGNSQNGVLINGAGSNAIGSAALNASNTIAFNGSNGVAVVSGVSNAILSNAIFSNSSLGIDLGNNGVTPNDVGDADNGANNVQNFPVLTTANSAGGSTSIQGTFNSFPNGTFRIEFFSNNFSNPSGFGEGETFLGFTSVITDASGNASFNVTIPGSIAQGKVITATATDSANNTSEFCRGIQVGGLAGGQPADLSVLITMPVSAQTGSEFTKTILVSNAGPNIASSVTLTDSFPSNVSILSCNASGGGVCSGTGTNRTVTFASFPPGTSAVITIVARLGCTIANGTLIGNTATVFSATTPDPLSGNNIATVSLLALNPNPTITCPGTITRSNDPGQCAAIVPYSVLVNDNCPGVAVLCSPPSGASFVVGTTNVTCTATDSGGATASCSFSVIINDTEPLSIACPANLMVTTTSSQCTPVVSYALPRAFDNCPGATVTCTPPPGSTFPVGTTLINCVATDARGSRATCSFSLTVVGHTEASLIIEGGGAALEYGPVAARAKNKKEIKQQGRNLTVENTGCATFTLSLESVRRLGNDVNNGRIGDPDDKDLFPVYIVSTDGALTKMEILKHLTINPGQKAKFRVIFNPIIPTRNRAIRGLPAIQVLPDTISSRITFRLSSGAGIEVNIFARLIKDVVLTHPEAPRRGPLVTFARVDDEFIVEYTIYDPNLDVNRASYQFFDKDGRLVQQELSVDLAPLVSNGNFVRGQSFTVVQRFTGAKDNKGIVGIKVTVFDSESNVSANSVPGDTANLILESAIFQQDWLANKLLLPGINLTNFPLAQKPATGRKIRQ
ncbi:MAG: HYR domain-containing protein [Acidobacteriota bacterium]